MLYQIGGFLGGAAVSSIFIMNMNDLIYSEMRRNVLIPFNRLLYKDKSGQSTSDALKDLRQGSLNLASQFKPHSLGPANARQLLVDDKDFQTPADSYFGYIAKRKEQAMTAYELERRRQVIENL